MSCQHKLSWYELIPVFSFIVLGGRCKNCKTKISIQYPIVELLTGFIFAAVFYKLQGMFFTSTLSFIISYIYYTALFSILLVVAVYDIKHKIIPDILSVILGVVAFIGIFFISIDNPVVHFHIPSILVFLSGVLVAFPFAFFWLISRGRWMGLGDAKLALGIGWMLGIASALSALVVAFWSGAIIGVALIIIQKSRAGGMNMKSEIPFAPFLVFGTLIAFVFGLNLFNL